MSWRRLKGLFVVLMYRKGNSQVLSKSIKEEHMATDGGLQVETSLQGRRIEMEIE